MAEHDITHLERVGSLMDTARIWLIRSWKLATLMTKGAYLIGERKQLFFRLGEQVYYKIQKGEIKVSELDDVVAQLDRLTKKIEIEEMLVRTTRFGKAERKRAETQPSPNEA